MVFWAIGDTIGIIAFVISGSLVAVEEDYDIFGILLLGLMTGYGGGVIRNLLLGIPVSSLWHPGWLPMIALLTALGMAIVPIQWGKAGQKLLSLFDAIGLSAFAIQGAQYAFAGHHSVVDITLAATITGIGGGVIRDILAGRKPFVLRSNEYYAIWAMLDGLIMASGLVRTHWSVFVLFIVTVGLRLLSAIYHWKVPRHRWSTLNKLSSEL